MGLFGKEKKAKEPKYILSSVNIPMINYKVYYMNAKEKILYFLLLFTAGGVAGLIFYGGLFKSNGHVTFATFISNIVVFCLIGFLSNKLFMKSVAEMLRKKRIARLKMQFREFLSSLSTSLSSGSNMIDSLSSVKTDMEMQFTENSEIVAEVDGILKGITNGFPVEHMIAEFGERSGIEDVQNFAIVFETAYRTGGNLKEIVRRTADIIAEKTTIAAEIETKLTSNKMQMNVMLVIPLVIMVMLRFASKEFAASFATIIGVICVTVSVALFVTAYVIGQKIMDIKE